MKKLRFTDSEVIETLKRTEAGPAVSQLCRELGISNAMFYKWRAKFGGMDASVMARMKGAGGKEPPAAQDVRRRETQG